jgi:mono/diheme cytochrome c family protein
VAAVAVVVFGAALAYALTPTSTRAIPAQPEATKAVIDAGRYVAVASDCIACHSAPGGKPFAGGLAMASPIGTIYSTNITPDKKTGIGNYSLNDFDRAVRHGITPAGGTLYPAMPYPSYAKMTDQDVAALYAYFMHDVKPVEAANHDTDIAWPLSIRWPLAIWRKQFAPAVQPVDLAQFSDQKIARGAYLVQSMGHCGSCHTARAPTMQEKSLGDGPEYLAGGQVIDGWLAVNLRGDAADGLGRWSEQDIVDTLRTGRNAHSAVMGAPMNDVVLHSTQNMTDTDLHAMAAYIKSLPPARTDAAASPLKFAASDATYNALRVGQESGRGAQLYVDNCVACHRSDAVSNGKVFPALAGNPSVLQADPTSVIRLILGGAQLPSTHTAPSNLGMPAFGWRLSDDETAQLVTFVRQSWGNSAPAATAEQVATVRKTLSAQQMENHESSVTAVIPAAH